MSTQLQPNDVLWDDLFIIDPEKGRLLKQPLRELSDRFILDPIYEYKGFALKYFTESREIAMAELAGDCGVKVHGHIIRFDAHPNNGPRKVGLVMEVGRPLIDSIKEITDESEKHRIKAEMIAVVERLHTKYNMVHGDIKPANFVVCKDNEIRLCDFESARPADESSQIWEHLMDESIIGEATEQYYNKSRSQDDYVPPTKADDLYALAISVWELYTGKVPFEGIESGEEIRSHHSTGQTVDLTEVQDDETREWIRGILREGGALV
ncbi:hypothetical protein AOL_s00080g423 [Orbilia oligospora ATCC 24927]|uniref:Protein kinase domain-containing protein n=1 Tax=Arthrobotrys oligospora (strain ATCC 24927 / CBS 115.81 / DSM 1491) TaxID=756982 RepID=G1XF38_ARTOA|nr:hypothetical protein AOL_s00080g423 [Orbilia oligospora ATCC 24927]EGX48298.1 hypothetical protein AOL_s00080g423 [Orbilia oligospora ATCC 24927]